MRDDPATAGAIHDDGADSAVSSLTLGSDVGEEGKDHVHGGWPPPTSVVRTISSKTASAKIGNYSKSMRFTHPSGWLQLLS